MPLRRTAATLILVSLVFAHASFAKPPSWDKVITGPARFKVLPQFSNGAVLDLNTGLVWQKNPILASPFGPMP